MHAHGWYMAMLLCVCVCVLLLPFWFKKLTYRFAFLVLLPFPLQASESRMAGKPAVRQPNRLDSKAAVTVRRPNATKTSMKAKKDTKDKKDKKESDCEEQIAEEPPLRQKAAKLTGKPSQMDAMPAAELKAMMGFLKYHGAEKKEPDEHAARVLEMFHQASPDQKRSLLSSYKTSTGKPLKWAKEVATADIRRDDETIGTIADFFTRI